MKDSQYQIIKRGLNSKLLLIGGFIILVFFGINFIKSWNKNREINQEIDTLSQKIQNLEKDNLELSGLIKYLNSTAYIEEKARTDLGLKKEGEKTIIIPDLSANPFSDSLTDKKITESEKVSNPKKWWQFFFIKNYD